MPATWENLTGALESSFPGDEIELQVLHNSNINTLKVITEALSD